MLLAKRSDVTGHHCTSGTGPVEDWLARSAAFDAGPQARLTAEAESAASMAQRLPLLTPEGEEALLREARFTDPVLYYAALSFRAWAACAGGSDEMTLYTFAFGPCPQRVGHHFGTIRES